MRTLAMRTSSRVLSNCETTRLVAGSLLVIALLWGCSNAPSWQQSVESDRCTSNHLIQEKEKWQTSLAEENGKEWVALHNGIHDSGNPPPIVCRKDCPIEITPDGKIGSIKIGTRVGQYGREFKRYNKWSGIISGVYSVELLEDSSIECITVSLFDFPEECLVSQGHLIKRTDDLEQVASAFHNCQRDEKAPGVPYRCDGKVVVRPLSFEGPQISLCK